MLKSAPTPPPPLALATMDNSEPGGAFPRGWAMQTGDSIRYERALVSCPSPSPHHPFRSTQLQRGPAERLLALHCISAST